MNKKWVLFILFLSFTSVYHANPIKKAFHALSIYDYFSAKKSFEKLLEKKPAIANYGLSIIYGRKDNPFFNYESAYQTIMRSDSAYSLLKLKQKQKYSSYNYSKNSIDSLKELLALDFFKNVTVKENSEASYQHFVSLYNWSRENALAVHRRDSIAYQSAKKVNSSMVYARFMEKYPNSEYKMDAQADFYRQQYAELTQSKRAEDYEKFIVQHPENPYVKEAEDRLYDPFLKTNTIAAYSQFIKQYPKNPNVELAWRKIYQLFMFDYSENRFSEFLEKYPNYPFKQEVLSDEKYASLNLYPFRNGVFLGWMNGKGEEVYPADYESLNFFSEGLAAASKRGKFGFIDKKNKIVIPFIYDEVSNFSGGRAIVEVNDKYGIIDRTGTLVFDTIYTDIDQFSEGLIYAQLNGKYYYFDKYGNKPFNEGFDDAFPFSDGYAVVKIGDNQTIIDRSGKQLVPAKYSSVKFFTSHLFVVAADDKFGLVNRKGDTILPIQYDVIGELSDNRAIISVDDKFGYIDSTGKMVLNLNYETYPNFTQNAQFEANRAKVQQKGKFGVIDSVGKVILPLKFINLGDIHSSLIAFSDKKNKWGFLSKSGKIVIEPMYDYAESFHNGYAVAELVAQEGVINQQKAWIIPNKFSQVSRFEEDFWVAADGARMYLYDLTGKLLSQEHYQQIRKISNDVILLQSSENLDYYSISEKKLIHFNASK